jgi:hypothetical protein
MAWRVGSSGVLLPMASNLRISLWAAGEPRAQRAGGFGANQADVALQRRFHVTEKGTLALRVEMFNVFNHANFGPPNGDLSSPLFGRSMQTLASSLGSGGANGGLNPLYQVGGPRSIQLALRLLF